MKLRPFPPTMHREKAVAPAQARSHLGVSRQASWSGRLHASCVARQHAALACINEPPVWSLTSWPSPESQRPPYFSGTLTGSRYPALCQGSLWGPAEPWGQVRRVRGTSPAWDQDTLGSHGTRDAHRGSRAFGAMLAHHPSPQPLSHPSTTTPAPNHALPLPLRSGGRDGSCQVQPQPRPPSPSS